MTWISIQYHWLVIPADELACSTHPEFGGCCGMQRDKASSAHPYWQAYQQIGADMKWMIVASVMPGCDRSPIEFAAVVG